jgi:hypothetical protein
VKLDITARAGLATENELLCQGQHLGEIRNTTQIGAHQPRRREQFDREAVGFGFLHDVARGRAGRLSPGCREVFPRAGEPVSGVLGPVPRVEEMAELVAEREPPPSRDDSLFKRIAPTLRSSGATSAPSKLFTGLP